MTRQPSVADHLKAFGETPDWVLCLGDLICGTTQCSSAIAASRARDLSRQTQIGKAFESLLKGWQSLNRADLSVLSPMQHETVHLVIRHVLESLNAQVSGPTEIDLGRKEL